MDYTDLLSEADSCSLITKDKPLRANNGRIKGNRIQEYRARLWVYNRVIGLHDIISAYKAGCQNVHDMAEHLDVTEEFLSETLSCYRQKYGVYTKLDNYVIYFEPSIGVFEYI